MSKTLTLAATGMVGLVLGAGIGAAAAGQTDTPATPERSEPVTAMDDMHAAMVDDMPAELAEQCDQMHADMDEHMGDADHASMMGDTGTSGAAPTDHDAHHPDTEE